FASTTITLAGVGLAVAATYVAIDSFGNIVIKRCFEVTTDSTASLASQPIDDPLTSGLEEC
nr:nonstructural protein NS4A [Hepacivirus P]